MKLFTGICMILIMLSVSVSGQKNGYVTSSHLWKPQKDEVYLQEVSSKVPTSTPVTSVAEYQGTCYAVMNGNIYVLSGNEMKPVFSSPKNVTRLLKEEEDLWALAPDGIYRYENKKWNKLDNHQFVDLCMHNNALYAATKDDIFRFEKGGFVNVRPEAGYMSSNTTQLLENGSRLHDNPALGPVSRICSYSGVLYILRPGKLVQFDGEIVNEDFVDWGTLPSENTGDMLRSGNRVYIATDRGLSVLRGAALTTLKGKDGLPVENTTCLAKGNDGDVWIGTARGAVRMVNDEWHYFGADLWLPDNYVNAVAAGDRKVYIATNKGLGIISYEPYTLQKKAAYYEQHLEEWGHKRMGFIHSLYKKDGEWIREISDNDGGHTAPYLAAMCYKYAVTGDEEARKEAIRSFHAMLCLERIVPVEGFFARAIWSAADKDDRDLHGSGGLPAKWHSTPDGKWFWKGDTSSDEVTAHFYAVSLFYELVAEGKEKELAKEHLQRIASYIIDCGWVLKGMDGKPTRWGRWNPEYLLRSYGYVDRGLNSLEVLSYTKTALALTGDEKFRQGYQQLIDWGYPELTVRQKNVFPPETIAPWDDDLAFQSYYTLFRYADSPELRSVYLRSIERTWEIKRIDHIPWYNFVYGLVTGNDCETGKAVKCLRECILDCVDYSYCNSHRDDLFTEPGYSSYEGKPKSLSPRESSLPGDGWDISSDGGAKGTRVTPPTGFLRDYWMGRYYGFIEAPETNDPDLISVKKDRNRHVGADPYKGPDIPAFE